MLNFKIFSLICCFLASITLTAQKAGIIIVTEHTTNPAANNGKMTIEIATSSVPAPYLIEITGPLGYNYTTTVPTSKITLSSLSWGNYAGTIIADNGCSASFSARVEKCEVMPVPGGGTRLVCAKEAEDGDGSVARFYATGYVDGGPTAPEPTYTFVVFHAMPDYLYTQIYPYISDAMLTETQNLIQTDYSPYEVFEQNEFQADAPYIFAFSPDGSLIWVYRNVEILEREKNQKDNALPQQKVWQIFPNPASTSVSIPSGEAVGNLSVRIINCFGQVVYANTFSDPDKTEYFVVDISGLPAGIYFIYAANAESKQEIYKLIKI